MGIKNLLDRSTSLIDIKKKIPDYTEGRNGELSFYLDNTGFNLYGKLDNQWHKIGNMSLTNPLGKVNSLQSTPITGKEIKTSKDTDKFCMFDQGVIKYTTGDNLLSYIGIAFGISETNITKCGAGIVDDDFIRVNGTTFEGRSASEVRSDIGAGTSSVSALDDLSDVSYSSGDLTITNLDTIKSNSLSGTVDGSNLNIQAQDGSGTNSGGGDLILEAGQQTGNHATSSVYIKTGVLSGSTGTTVRDIATVGRFTAAGLRLEATDGGTGVLTLGTAAGADSLILDENGIQVPGDLVLDAGGGDITLTDDTLDFAKFTQSDSSFTLYEAGEDASVDYFKVACGANGATTISTVHAFAALAHLTLDADGDIILDAESGITKFYKAGDTDDLCTLTVAANGATTLATSDSDGAAGHLTLDPNGDLIISGADVKIDATQKLYLDGGTHTYIHEQASDVMTFTVGASDMLLLANTVVGDYAKFDCGAGFVQKTPTYNATTTNVQFDAGNKQFLTFDGGDIADLKLHFPAVSGNFVLLLKQDGTGGREVASDGWLAYDQGGTAAAGSAEVKWAGGAVPTLTTDANHVDILSFYWDSDNEIAYGVATLDFQF